MLDRLADALSDLERDNEAVAVKREILARCQKIYGELDNHTISAMDSLAYYLWRSGKKKESAQLEKKISELRRDAVEFSKQKYGEGHSQTIEAINNLIRVETSARAG